MLLLKVRLASRSDIIQSWLPTCISFFGRESAVLAGDGGSRWEAILRSFKAFEWQVILGGLGWLVIELHLIMSLGLLLFVPCRYL